MSAPLPADTAPDDARKRYLSHKANAKTRGIEFEFTFEEWWEIWSPHYANRGRRKGQLVMCRTRDEGAYRPGNVRIDSVASNGKERGETMTRRAVLRDWVIDGEDRRDCLNWVYERGSWAMDYFKRRRLEEKAAEGEENA